MDNAAIIARILKHFENKGYEVIDNFVRDENKELAGGLVMFNYQRICVREALVSMGAPSVIKVDVRPPLVGMRFATYGFWECDKHLRGELRLHDDDGKVCKVHSNAYMVINRFGEDRVVAVFTDEREVLAFMEHVLSAVTE